MTDRYTELERLARERLEWTGVKIYPHSMAVRIVHKVQRHPMRKRRRNYRVVRVVQPACFQVGNAFYMHPELIAKLPALRLALGEKADG